MREGGFKNEPALFFGKLPANAVPLVKPLLRLLILLSGLLALEAHAAPAARQVLAEAALTDDDTRRRELIVGLAGSGDPAIAETLEAWRTDQLFIQTAADGSRRVVRLTGDKDAQDAQAATRLDDGKPLLTSTGAPLRLVASDLTAVEHNASLRREIGRAHV